MKRIQYDITQVTDVVVEITEYNNQRLRIDPKAQISRTQTGFYREFVDDALENLAVFVGPVLGEVQDFEKNSQCITMSQMIGDLATLLVNCQVPGFSTHDGRDLVRGLKYAAWCLEEWRVWLQEPLQESHLKK